MQIGYRVAVTRICARHGTQSDRVEVVPVREFRPVQWTKRPRLDFTTEEVRRGTDHIVTKIAGPNPTLEGIGRVIGTVLDLNAGTLLKIRHGALADVALVIRDVKNPRRRCHF